MVKIKRKVEMTQKEFVQFLIEKAAINEITQSTKNGKDFELCIKLKSDNNKINRINNNLVEVEVEEEITDDTVITNLVEVYEYNGIMESVTHGECSIINALDEDLDNVSRLAFYMLNDDMTMTLLWRNGEMVE